MNMPESYKYKEDTIYQGEFQKRGLEDYEKIFDFRRDDLQGMKILDLGANLENRFANQLKKANIEVGVVSLSPDFKKSGVASIAKGSRYDPLGLFFFDPHEWKELIKEKLNIRGV